MPLAEAQRKYLEAHRVGHLATADRLGRPHVVPVCFACDGSSVYSVLDAKPKRVRAPALKRVRNIEENPHIAIVVDDYDEDWSRLSYLMILGTARIVTQGDEHARALGLLREKYPQYRAMALESAPVIAMTIARTVSWSARRHS
ncbi:MAG TPA: TIGR03668 family PPOX class F420-dependent oxidoreductase [Candidatus Acidoferrales bacterium]|nr:TIGR03668 family PPOX class F420-dependent oxidoreductase [Candidatus Acidoferrales bacterium]